MKTTRPTLIALTAALTLGIAACGSTDDPDAGDETATVSSSSTSDSTGSDDDTTDDDDAASADDATADSSDDSTTGSSGDGDLQSVLDAIEAAEKEADGTAYEVDDQDDDGSWEIDVATGTQTIEVEVSEDGKATTDDEDDLDDEDRDGLDAAEITFGDAITAALDEVDGTFDDAELEEEGTHHWVVTIDSADRGDDVEVKVDVTDGTVISVDD